MSELTNSQTLQKLKDFKTEAETKPSKDVATFIRATDCGTPFSYKDSHINRFPSPSNVADTRLLMRKP